MRMELSSSDDAEESVLAWRYIDEIDSDKKGRETTHIYQ
jgi:hypothetical protein